MKVLRTVILLSFTLLGINLLSSCERLPEVKENREEFLAPNTVEIDKVKNKKFNFGEIKSHLIDYLNNDLIILNRYAPKLQAAKISEKFSSGYKNKINKDLWKVHKSNFKGDIREIALIKKEQYENTARKELLRYRNEKDLLTSFQTGNKVNIQKINNDKKNPVNDLLKRLAQIDNKGSEGYFEAREALELTKSAFEKDIANNIKNINIYLAGYKEGKEDKNFKKIKQIKNELEILLKLSREMSIINWYLLRNEMLNYLEVIGKIV